MEMVKNVGSADRAVRGVVGLVLAYLFFANAVAAPLSYLVLLVAIVMLATAALGWCHLYTLLKMNTAKKK